MTLPMLDARLMVHNYGESDPELGSDWWIKVASDTYVCMEYRAVLIDMIDHTVVRALNEDDIERWDLWDYFYEYDFDEEGHLITYPEDFE